VARFRSDSLALVLGIFAVLPSIASGAAANRQLEGIRKKIENEKKGLSQLQVKEGSVLDSLGKIQNDLDMRNQELKRANAKLIAVSDELALKESEAQSLDESITSRVTIFNRRAAALYKWHKSGSPFAILNGNFSVSDLLQRRKYLATALSFDRQLLLRLEQESEHQEILRRELATKKQELDEEQRALAAAKQAVRREAEKKQILLATVRREKNTRLKVLREMEAAAARLEKVIEEISKRALNKPRETQPPRGPGSGLEALRGKMEWPVRGKVIAPFGTFRHPEFGAEIVRKGIDIDAPVGEEIRAVEKGVVAYADRFAGYGKMVIVDHGERYYTIYGHLSEILKKIGDEVRRGEVIGKAGDSDSLAGAKLYFEMRKDGHSLDPMPWFRKQ
jgi:septal ring factor EnvC (AmiA/AmiB activator)